MPLNEPHKPEEVVSRFNPETNKHEVIDTATGAPALNTKGTRMDGGGNVDGVVSVRQAGHIQVGIDRARKKAVESGLRP